MTAPLPASAYLERLGLCRSPFPPTPDATSYFQNDALERDLAEAVHCLLARKGFVLLTGEVGMGKSTFLRRLLDAVQERGAVASLVFNTFLQGPELLAAICRDFGLAPGTDAAANIDALNRFLLQRWQDGRTCVLVIDDAQNLDIKSLELLRLLSNLENGQEKLLQIVLAGQPELDAALAQPAIRQLASRIVKHIRMDALDARDCARYVEFRLAQAGAAGRIRIDAPAHLALHRRSGGNPRRVHLIMDRCLYGVVARGDLRIDAALVRAAAAEAGFLPMRRMRRQGPVLAAALLLATGLATAAGLAWHGDGPGPVADAGVPPAPVARRSGPDTFPIARWHACLQRLSPTGSGGRPLQVLAVPPRHRQALAHRGDLCVRARGEAWLVAWQPSLAAEQLQPGRRSDAVRQLQARLLANAAPADADIVVDGLLGPRTRAALADFQRQHHLPPSGRADPLTLLLLDGPAADHPDLSRTSPESSHGRA